MGYFAEMDMRRGESCLLDEIATLRGEGETTMARTMMIDECTVRIDDTGSRAWGVYVLDWEGKSIGGERFATKREAMREYAVLRDLHRGGHEVAVYHDDEMIVSSHEDDE